MGSTENQEQESPLTEENIVSVKQESTESLEKFDLVTERGEVDVLSVKIVLTLAGVILVGQEFIYWEIFTSG